LRDRVPDERDHLRFVMAGVDGGRHAGPVVGRPVDRRRHGVDVVELHLVGVSAKLRRDVFGDAMGVAMAGTAVGLMAALWVSGLLKALLFEVTTVDPAVALTSAALLMAAALAASYLPARRAARVDPIAALKTD